MVLYRATMPAVLLELGFLSNAKDEKLLTSESGQKKLAQHVFEGFKRYKERYDGVDKSLKSTELLPVDSSTIKESKDEIIQKEGVFLKVQIATSSSKISTLPENFNGLKGVEVYISGKFYKYTYGNCVDMDAAKKMLSEAKSNGYPSAFITAFENGNKINLNEALKKLNKQPNEN